MPTLLGLSIEEICHLEKEMELIFETLFNT